jgi:RNA polymerase sigma-70 factor (ECF subfamily)
VTAGPERRGQRIGAPLSGTRNAKDNQTVDAQRNWRHDHVLIEAAQSGDEEALLTLLKAAQPDIRRYARQNCRTADDVEDAVQETLWLLYRRVGTIRAFTSISGWLFTVARRECQRMARRMFGTHTTDIESMHDDLRLSERPPHELRLDLAEAIGSLPEHYRQVVLLRDIEEMSVDEIGATLGLTREAVKARLHRARGLIREYLKD